MGRIKSVIRHACVGLAAAAMMGAAITPSSASVINVGGYASFDSSGFPAGDLGAAMQNAANFPAFGVTGFADAGHVAFGSATAGYLNGVDMFFTGRLGITSTPTANDISNLVNFVNGGGVLVVNNDRSTSFTSLDPLLNAFGVDIVSGPTDSVEALNIDDPAHPIMDGPFGQVLAMGLRDASRYAALIPEVNIAASWQNGDGAIATLGPGAGRDGAVIVLPDVERFLLDFDSNLGTGDTEIATLNAVAFGVSVINGTPIPEPGMLAIIGLGFAGIYAVRRHKAIKIG